MKQIEWGGGGVVLEPDTQTVFAFCFVLESCKHQVGRIECLCMCLVQQKTIQALQARFSKQ